MSPAGSHPAAHLKTSLCVGTVASPPVSASEPPKSAHAPTARIAAYSLSFPYSCEAAPMSTRGVQSERENTRTTGSSPARRSFTRRGREAHPRGRVRAPRRGRRGGARRGGCRRWCRQQRWTRTSAVSSPLAPASGSTAPGRGPTHRLHRPAGATRGGRRGGLKIFLGALIRKRYWRHLFPNGPHLRFLR
jgi:hypothetical protein